MTLSKRDRRALAVLGTVVVVILVVEAVVARRSQAPVKSTADSPARDPAFSAVRPICAPFPR